MINFLIGMLVMYLITGIIMCISETFGDGVLDEWLYFLFAWWINLLFLPVALVIKQIKINKKNNKRA